MSRTFRKVFGTKGRHTNAIPYVRPQKSIEIEIEIERGASVVIQKRIK